MEFYQMRYLMTPPATKLRRGPVRCGDVGIRCYNGYDQDLQELQNKFGLKKNNSVSALVTVSYTFLPQPQTNAETLQPSK